MIRETTVSRNMCTLKLKDQKCLRWELHRGVKRRGKTGRGISRVRWDLKMNLVLCDDKGTCSERRMGCTEKKMAIESVAYRTGGWGGGGVG
jgi:hypothetical protein